ncbi:MAG TPA: substrate-binding domain-containing protein [Usitatibacter sp.]|jgi:molybdate transport repressor ModE-like protein
MHRLAIKPLWVLRDHPDGERLMTQLLPLLAGIHETGSLALACGQAGASYRHGWGLVKQAGQVFGAPLVDSVRGRGAKLTALGEKLLWAEKRISARLSPTLESLATELEAELERASPNSRGVLRIHASHAFALTMLRDTLARRHLPLEISYKGSSQSLASFHHGDCDIAGFHVPVGELEKRLLSQYARWLKSDANVLVNLVERRQGIIVAPDNPKNVISIADLARPGVRFVNRQEGSGTRLIFDHLMERAGVAGKRIRGYDQIEYTHAAVAAYIASGMADAGIGVETAARQFHLGFVPLMNERYFLIVRREALESPIVEKVLAVMRSKDFRMQLLRLQGLDCARCGSIEEIGQAFPALASQPRRARARAAA